MHLACMAPMNKSSNDCPATAIADELVFLHQVKRGASCTLFSAEEEEQRNEMVGQDEAFITVHPLRACTATLVSKRG